MTTEKRYQEPKGDEPGGLRRFTLPLSGYEKFMKEEGIPIFRGIGVYDVRQLSLAPWKRLGGRGIFIQLDGCAALRGMYVVEVPAAGALNPDRHLYHEFMYIVEGRGSTEIWREGSAKMQTFEWQAGSMFMIPINTHHRLVNATSSPALVLVTNNAPPIMNLFQSRSFVFDNPYEFREQYDESDDFFKLKADQETVAEPVRGRARLRSNFFPDILHCELPLDNQRAPGYRRINPGFTGFPPDSMMGGFISQYPSGRYSKAHYHGAGAVLVCLRGKGYTYNWPITLGQRPWEAGKGDLVKRQDYVPGGLVAAAPGGGMWFHQHFGIATDTFRVINFWAGPSPGSSREEEEPGHEIPAWNLYSPEQGGSTINYRDEDPYIRAEYEATLKREGVKFNMPESLYR